MEETRPAERCKQNSSKGWEDLDSNILKNIFSRIHSDDLLRSVSFVCCSWCSATLDFLFWNRDVLDLHFAMAAFNDFSSVKPTNLLRLYSCREFPGKYPSPVKYDQMAGKLTKLLKHILPSEGNDAYGHSLGNWRRSIHTIIIPYDLELADEHLLYIAQRSPGVRHLSLLGTHKITSEGFAKVIRNWKFLKSIHLGPVKNEKWYSHIIQEIGKNCKQVEELYFHHAEVMMKKSNSLAMDIVRNLPGLKKIGFEAAVIFMTGLSIFLDTYKCPHLQEMDFSECSLTGELESYFPQEPDVEEDSSYCVTSTFGLERKRTTDEYYVKGSEWRVKNRHTGLEFAAKYVALVEGWQYMFRSKRTVNISTTG